MRALIDFAGLMPVAKLLSFFKDSFSPAAAQTPEASRDRIRLATAAVLLETAYADAALSKEEEKRVLDHIRRDFQLDEATARALLDSAEKLRSNTIDHWNLTHVIRKSCSLEERIEIVKTMWRIVYSDGSLHEYENYLVRKLADLLGLEHHVMIEAKLSVQKEV